MKTKPKPVDVTFARPRPDLDEDEASEEFAQAVVAMLEELGYEFSPEDDEE